MEQESGAAAPAARPFGGLGVDTVLAAVLLFAGAILFLALAPSAYYAYLAIHILSAVIWVGGDVTLTTLGIVFERARDGETLGALGQDGRLDRDARLYAGAVRHARLRDRAHAEGQLRLGASSGSIFGLVGWTIAALVGVGFVGPELGRIDEAARSTAASRPRWRCASSGSS